MEMELLGSFPGHHWHLGPLAVLLFTFVAAKCSYHYLQLQRREKAVKVTLPPLPELRHDWRGIGWDQVSKDDRQILEGQKNGVFNGSKILSYCPADGRMLGDPVEGIKPATVDEIEAIVKRAKIAQEHWRQTTFADRRKVLRTLLELVLQHQDELAKICCLDTGKTKVDACFGEVLVTAAKLQWTIDHGEKALSPETRSTNLLMMYKKNTVRYEPLGVVAACVSWNYALHNVISPVIEAIFAGNSIVVKPSEHTAWSCNYFISIIRRAIEGCGFPPDIVQSAVCLPETADSLTSHPSLDHIVFIGSRPVAHHVATSAAKALTSVTVELGGKDPCIILDDAKTIAELPTISSILMRGVFQSSGQNCVGLERIIALPAVYDKIVNIVAPRIKALRLGSVLLDSLPKDKSSPKTPAGMTPDVGAMISTRSFDTLEALISEAVSQGAKLICGGKRYEHPQYPYGHYFTPTLLIDVTPSMRIAQTEVFGPVFVMMRAQTVDDAIAIANSSSFALGASLFGNVARDIETCVSRVRAGMVAVNDFGIYYLVGLPFGGVKGSGYGRFGGVEGLRGMSNLKAVSVDMIPGIKTSIPPPLDFPIYKGPESKRNGEGAWEMCKGVVETGNQTSIARKGQGVWRILKNL